MSSPKPPSRAVAVYCASSTGKDPAYRNAAVCQLLTHSELSPIIIIDVIYVAY